MLPTGSYLFVAINCHSKWQSEPSFINLLQANSILSCLTYTLCWKLRKSWYLLLFLWCLPLTAIESIQQFHRVPKYLQESLKIVRADKSFSGNIQSPQKESSQQNIFFFQFQGILPSSIILIKLEEYLQKHPLKFQKDCEEHGKHFYESQRVRK